MDNYEEEIERSHRSFRPRAVDFREIVRSELGSQRNVGEQTRTKVTQREFSGSGMIATITRLCYGTLNEKRACIIVFEFFFRWSRDDYQFRHLEAEISFGPRSKSSKTQNVKYPVVRNLSPGKAYGIPNTNGKKWSIRVEQQCGVPSHAIAPDKLGQKAFEEAHRVEILGRRWSDSRRRDFHKACWTINEVGTPNYGIPDEFKLAVLVEYEDVFDADLRMTVDVPFHRRLQGFPWPADDPILFTPKGPGTVIGEPLSTTRFETLSDAEWELLVSDTKKTAPIPISHHTEGRAPSTNHMTYRVQGIPKEHLPDIAKFLREVLELSGDSTEIRVGSVAADLEHQDEIVATVNCSRIESVLDSSDQWHKALPANTDGTRLAKRSYIALDTKFHDFTPFTAPEDHLLDIIAISGLGGHAFGSFKERNGSHMWLRDDLPFDFPRARILTYGYDSKLKGSQSFQDFEAIASTFCQSLKIARPKSPDGKPNDKPIIFIAHSLGGIVLKQALIQMADGDNKDKKNSQLTRGILFFGVPSQGMDITSLLAMIKGQVNEQFLNMLGPNSSVLRNQQREFCAKFSSEACKIMSFYETELSPTIKEGNDGWRMNGEPAILVGQSSATLGSRAWETSLTHNLSPNVLISTAT
ncbi:hypothetical protein V498_08740 [Pseudogymnoascus sp. VKM F-4517 (FW-2822)]|nr:hypothetical protein V498_08740 [Pseudogymnoascus sp. VKM F-4517 (FW-2822)]